MAVESQTWPMAWRITILLNVSFYNLLGNAFAAGVPPLYGLLISEFHCTVDEVSHLATYALLMLGLANLCVLPVVECFGKRYTILISLAVFLATNIWSATVKTFPSLVATRFVGGLSGGVVEALGPMVISEIFPEAQLARAMVVYVGFLAAGSAVGPIVAGSVASGMHSWRWFFGITSILTGINFIGCIAMLPETIQKYDQPLTCVSAPESEGKPSAEEHPIELRDTIQSIATSRGSQTLTSLWIERSFFWPHMNAISKIELLRLLIQPFAMLLAPAVLVSTLVFGTTIGWTAVSSILVANVFESPPSSWGPKAVGLINVGPLIGLLVGLPLGGLAADMLSRRASRLSGQHEPKSRLPAVLLGGFVSPAGCLIIGISLEKHFHWIGVAVGWAMLAFGLTASTNVLLTYSIDCFRSRAGQIGVVVNVVKNCLAFGVSYASITWYTRAGPAAQFGTMAGILWACYLTVVPLYLYSHALQKFSFKVLGL